MALASERPVILLNMAVEVINGRECDVLISRYAERVSAAGAVPMLTPSIECRDNLDPLLALADGVLLIGGKDYHPSYYGCRPAPETDLGRLRPHFDIAFGAAVMQCSMPVLGICGGCQLLAILGGGRLIQHLPNAGQHTGGATHAAVIAEDGYLARALALAPGEEFTVNSFHHQAVDPERPGGFRITARAFDGSVEAVEQPGGRMVLGVQFHPERMDDLGPRIFSLLRDEAARFRRERRAVV